MLARAIVGGQPSFDCLVAGAPYPLPLLVEVWVLGSVPGGTVLTLMIGLAAAVAVLADLGGQWCRFGRLAALGLLAVPGQIRWARCPFVVPEVVLELDLLPLVDQLLADQQELIDGSLSPVIRVLCQGLFELRVESSVGLGVLRWVVLCDECVEQVLECMVHILMRDRVEDILLH